MWMNLARGANSDSLPVIRSSKRAPMAHDQIGLVHRVVGRPGAVHAEHPQPLLVRGREAAQPHHRAGDGEPVRRGQLGQLGGGVGADHAAAGVDHRPPGVGQRLGRQADLLLVAVGGGLIARQVHVGDRLVGDVGPAQVLRDVDHDRPGSAGAGDVERLVDRARELQRVLDHEAVLDDRHRDPDRVRLLEAVGAEQLGPHLAGQEHHRDRVHHRVADRRDQVGRAGAAGADRDADLAGGLGVALGGVTAAGLVADQDVTDAGVVEGVVGREVGAAGKPEYDVDTLGLQAFHQSVDCTHGASSFQRFGIWARAAAPRAADRRV